MDHYRNNISKQLVEQEQLVVDRVPNVGIIKANLELENHL